MKSIHPNEADAAVSLSSGFPVLVKITEWTPAEPDVGWPGSRAWSVYLNDGRYAPGFVLAMMTDEDESRIEYELDRCWAEREMEAAEYRGEALREMEADHVCKY